MVARLIFYGCSDDTFGEYEHTNDDYDNCASGDPIRWRVDTPNEPGLIVSGQYAPNNLCNWLVGIGSVDEDNVPDWPCRFVSDHPDAMPYSPVLEVLAPDDIRVTCIEREGA